MPALKGLERIYQRELKKPLKRFNWLKWLVPFAWLYTTFFLLLTTAAVFSLVLAFIPVVDLGLNQDKERVELGMYIAAFLGILGISWERISNYLSFRHKLLRESKLISFLLAVVFAGVIFVAAWYIGTNYLGHQLDGELMGKLGILIGVGIALSIPYFALVNYSEKFRNQYKSVVITKLLPLMDLNLEYNTVDRIPSSSFVKSKLYPCGEIAHYGTSDKFVGRSDDLRFEFCQIDVADHRKVGSRTRIMPRYKGLFFRLEVKTHFDGQAVLPSDELRKTAAGNMVGVLNGMLTRTDIAFSEVELTDGTLIYSTHPEEAKKLFTPLLLAEIKALRDKFNSDVSLSWAEDNVYITIPREGDYFWQGNGNLDNYKTLEEHMDKIDTLVQVPLSLKQHFSN